MQFFEDIINNVWVQRTFWSLVVIAINLFIYHIFSKFFKVRESRHSRILSSKKNKTFIRMLKSIVGYTLGILTVLVVLQIFGINVSSMLAGVGIASIIIGFALQDAMKDIFRGLDIISDGYYDIGDVIKCGDYTGKVLSIGIRTTKLQDINTMNVVSIANRNITEASVDAGYIYLVAPVPYGISEAKAAAAMQDIEQQLSQHSGITSATYQGITELASSSVNHQFSIVCDPATRLQTRRAALGIIYFTLTAHHISIPYQQLDVHLHPDH